MNNNFKIDFTLAEKYDVSCPYYTSYPTLSEWSDTFTAQDLIADLKNMCESGIKVPILLYVHFPFCKKRCYFCICNSIITHDRTKIREYLGYLFREIDLLKGFFEKLSYAPDIKRVHLGGGSPSYMEIEEFGMLIEKLGTIIDFNNLDEFATEVDSHTITREKLEYYHEKGVDRISFGIQDFDPDVQKAVNRVHSPEYIAALLPPDVRSNFKSINFDLLYGLPLQTQKSFANTIKTVKQLSPDRITLLKYAHVPDRRNHQRFIKESDIPDNYEKTAIFAEAVSNLTDYGYELIGIDHFAKPSDSLVSGMKNRTLWRNFNGFTDGGMHYIIGIGPTSTYGSLNCYAQNVYTREEYYNCIDNNEFPVLRGHKMSSDDLIRRHVINEILCYHSLDFQRIGHRFNIDFKEYFKGEINSLEDLQQDGMIDISANGITVTSPGNIFIRHVCKIFDYYLQGKKAYQITGP